MASRLLGGAGQEREAGADKRISKAADAIASGKPSLVWLQGATESGCTVSFSNAEYPDIFQAIEGVRLEFQQTLSAKSGTFVLDKYKKGGLDILVLEGAVPSGKFGFMGEDENGEEIPFENWVKQLGAVAKYAIAVGTCASFGGIHAARPNPTGCRCMQDVLPDKAVVKIPGCPPHPDWISLSLLALLEGKPLPNFWNKKVHERCNYHYCYENEEFSKEFDQDACRKKIGCKGQDDYADCAVRKWNRQSFCMEVGAPCTGCVSKGFPDATSPFFEEKSPVASFSAKKLNFGSKK